MNQLLMNAMHQYFELGKVLDVEKMDLLYATDFENIRMDKKGQTITLTKPLFMERFRKMKASGEGYDADTDFQFLNTSVYDNIGAVQMYCNENNSPAWYNFEWRMKDGKPVELVREYTIEEDLTPLLELIEKAKAAAKKN
jgi:hypothetical protein